ncbi:putative Demethylmenaquinone methyltransferase [Vibrio nigripulchritudo SFn27]|uniref:Putative 4-hydroxy-4-methyl-2-oxoglutarate aldolase n=1 Tax=Vibrio nigripulchritudo TaxID=28173 RepID=U4K1N6_9VIBR|nr:RraA family protein [Vibrio nigripulchritudo]CCN82039.1 putative Demethylmenaquinone methyltransferase [Vibrio nigripulchritudo BLFn1]CCN86317.1 putative Demethylmenaquinone methyltransferase [Vibrio nigripulchritudo SFn27]CCN96411.1 putative Demethylmenaquinone methyltransferase [Vibrio nigripulchritudo ENn2]CCO42007.1 putative Demethylmenaquinone methyltransferase [Vibrio nigripulchritudo SFn135]CCO53309.1 putative Demethylmenaquinone methyltransferase [Vibrio nigripulchritudo Wn13]
MSNDNALFTRIKEELFSAVIGDVMDKMGYTQQFFPPYLTILRRDMVIAGRAMTVLEADVFEEVSPESANPIMAKPFGLMFEALDSLKPNDVYVCTGSSPDYALWGGLMSTRAIKLGAAGAILDGYIRDSNEILSLNFPVASRGCYAQDQGPRGKVINYNVPLRVGQVQIQPGDIIFGDCDGVLCIPKEIEDEVISKALEKVRGESEVRKALENGMSTVEAFERFGIM